MALNNMDLEFEGIKLNNNGEVDGIEMLVSTVRQGKMDPWALDIVQVADQYSAKVFETKAQNLRYTSRVILFAAILLKMKSDILEGIDIIMPEDEQEIYDPTDIDMGYEYEDYVPTNNVIPFDEVLERRTSVRLNRNRVVTLRDLVRQLEFYAKLDKKAELKNAKERAKRRVRSYANITPDDIMDMAQDEYIKNGVEVLRANLEEILDREDKIELNELVLLGMDKTTAYLSLLNLAMEGDYDLFQEEFYSDLYVIKYQKPEKTEEEIMNEAFVNSALEDDVTSVVDSVMNTDIEVVQEIN